MRRDGGFTVSMQDIRYLWEPVDVEIRNREACQARAGWACKDVPGLVVNFTHREPCERFDNNLPKVCTVTHTRSGASLGVVPGSHSACARATVLLCTCLPVDWDQERQAVVACVGGLDPSMGDVRRSICEHTHKPRMEPLVLLENQSGVWEHGRELTKRLRKLATAEAVCIASQVYTIQNKKALSKCATYLDACDKEPSPLVMARLKEDDTVSIHVHHACGFAVFNLVCAGGAP